MLERAMLVAVQGSAGAVIIDKRLDSIAERGVDGNSSPMSPPRETDRFAPVRSAGATVGVRDMTGDDQLFRHRVEVIRLPIDVIEEACRRDAGAARRSAVPARDAVRTERLRMSVEQVPVSAEQISRLAGQTSL